MQPQQQLVQIIPCVLLLPYGAHMCLPATLFVVQAYGARSYKSLGLVLQRALLMCWVVCIPISVLWAYSEQVLLRLGQQPSIAAGAAM
jgi:Na+-driven multidrug efflux pump